MGQSCSNGKVKTPTANPTPANPITTAPPDLKNRKDMYEKKISFKEATSTKEIVNMVTSDDMFEFLVLGKSLREALSKVNPKDNEEIIAAIKEVAKMIVALEDKLQSSYKYPDTCKLVINDLNAIFSKKFAKYEKHRLHNRKRETCINILRLVTEVFNILKFYKNSNKMNSDQNKWWSDAKFMNNFNVVTKRYFLEATGDMERDKPEDGYPPSERGNNASQVEIERANSKKQTIEKQTTTDMQRAEAERDAKQFIDSYMENISNNGFITQRLEEMIDQEIKNMEINDNHSASACKGYSINKKVLKKNVK